MRSMVTTYLAETIIVHFIVLPLVFNQMIAFVQPAEVERFADRFYANPDSQCLTVVASPQDQAVVVYEGIDFFDSYQREHKGDEK